MPHKTKIPIREAIPASFAQAMKEVVRLIEANDDHTTIESDDLIQIVGEADKPFVVTGGLYSAEDNGYGFCLFKGDWDAGEGRDEYGAIEWCYYLGQNSIADIAAGKVSATEMWRCAEYDCGRRWSDPDGYCPRCDFLG